MHPSGQATTSRRPLTRSHTDSVVVSLATRPDSRRTPASAYDWKSCADSAIAPSAAIVSCRSDRLSTVFSPSSALPRPLAYARLRMAPPGGHGETTAIVVSAQGAAMPSSACTNTWPEAAQAEGARAARPSVLQDLREEILR